MSEDELERIWLSDPTLRFRVFTQWIDNDIQAYAGAAMIDFLQHNIDDNSQLATINYGGIDIPILQVSVRADIFSTDMDSETAVRVARMIIATGINYVTEFRRREEEGIRYERDKEYEKLVDKFIKQNLKNLAKDIIDTYKAIYKFLKKQMDSSI